MFDIEAAIKEVTTVYQTLTGSPIQPGKSELPPEEDPGRFVQARYELFRRLALGTPRNPPQHTWTPAADVVETEHDVRIEIDLAGVTKGDVSVSVDENVLWVRGKRAAINGGAIRHAERRTGPFQRGFVLPPRARKDRIDAQFSDGVLVIHVVVEPREAAESTVPLK